MTTPNTEAFAVARDQQQAWKSPDIHAYAVAFVEAGLDQYGKGVAYFGSDDVPEAAQPGPDSPGIAGSAVTMLRSGGVIEDYSGTHRDAEPPVIAGRRRSKRESANGRKVGLYRLADIGVVREWLKRHGKVIAEGQMEMGL